MHAAPFPRPLIARYGRLSDDDRAVVAERRRPHTRLGFAYQLAFLRLSGRLPQQQPLERAPDLLRYVAEQLNIDPQEVERYARRQPTISAHADAVASYLGYTAFSDQAREALIAALEGEVEHLEQPSALLGRAEEYLREQHVLRPARSALKRIAHEVRGAFRDRLYRQVDALLSAPLKSKLDALLETPGRYPSEAGTSPLQALREPPGVASPRAFNQEARKLDVVDRTGIQQVDLSWIRESLRKALARRVRNSDAHRLRLLKAPHRYAALACFLQETRAEIMDGLVEMHGKIITGTYRRAKNQLDDELKRHRRQVMATLRSFQAVARLLLDESVPDESLRAAIFSERSPEQLRKQLAEADAWLTGPKSDVFPYVRSRFSYLRQFAPALLNRLKLTATPSGHQDLVEAVGVLQELNETGRRVLPADAPTSFLPKTTRRFVETDGGKLDRAGYECAVLTAIRDEIRRGNLFVEGSARYRPTDAFFMPKPEWDQVRSAFFARSGLPVNAEEVTGHLQLRLEAAYDRFLMGLPRNAYVSVDPDGSWQLGSDSADPLRPDDKERLGRLTSWLERRARRIRLPDLLIEVDNDLRFTRHLGPGRSRPRDAEHVCQAVAGVIAYGCNLGPVAMARLTKGVTYAQIKRIADWHLHEDALRSALGAVTDGIARLNTAKVWGEGKTSSSDGQRYIFPRKTVKRTYSHRLSDYALEFYSFIADNYAPFYGVPIECNERDAAYVLDGLLYHESDLDIDEHFVDTHGYTECNFAAFAMLGKRFCPRIRGIAKQRIYHADPGRDYGPLRAMLAPRERQVRLEWIAAHWDEIARLVASFAYGHTTASVVMKRLVSFGAGNRLYRAMRELGRVFKTEFVLEYMAHPGLRRRVRRGLLKSEELHAMARSVFYGKLGRADWRDFRRQMSSASCLLLILAAIIYWQIREIERAIAEAPEEELRAVPLDLLSRVSPIGWENVTLYGEYVLRPALVKA